MNLLGQKAIEYVWNSHVKGHLNIQVTQEILVQKATLCENMSKKSLPRIQRKGLLMHTYSGSITSESVKKKVCY